MNWINMVIVFYLKNDKGVIEGSGIINDIAKDIPLLNILF